MSKLISIDPGINTGWCLWDEGHLVDYGCIIEPGYRSRFDNAKRVYAMTADMIGELHSYWSFEPEVVIEGTEFWDVSHKSRNAARTGSLQFLSMLVGSYCTQLVTKGCKVKSLISPLHWKGQMPDKLVKERANEFVFDSDPVKNIHVCCAIGIGAHHLGFKEFNHVLKNNASKKA